MRIRGVGAIRRGLGEWGRDLDDGSLVMAVGAAGVLEASSYLAESDSPARALTEQIRAINWTHPWRYPVHSLQLITAQEAMEAASGTFLPIAIDPEQAGPADLYTTVGFLNTFAGLLAHVAAESITEARWHWPLRVSVLDDQPLSQAVNAPLPWPNLIEVVDPHDGCDLLLLPWSAAVADEQEEIPDVGTVAMVVLMGPIDVPAKEVGRVADRLALRFSAEGAHLADAPPNRERWFRDLVESLAHNLPLNVALARASATNHYTAMSRPLVSDTRLDHVMGRFAYFLTHFGDRPIEIPPGLGRHLPGFDLTGTVPAGAVGEYLQQALNDGRFGFHSESSEATGMAALVLAARASGLPSTDEWAFANGHGSAPPEEGGEQVRIVNGTVKLGDDAHRLALETGVTYNVEIWIGVVSEESITLPGAPAFPDEELPSGPKVIDVSFTSLGNRKKTQTGRITLPDRGDSDRVNFELHYRQPGRIFGRIALSFQGRVVQTAVLRAGVEKERPSRLGRPRIEVEAVIRAGFEEVDEARAFDLALIVNRDDTGKKTASAITGGGVTIRDTDAIQQQIARLKDTLNAVADDPEAFASMTSPSSLELLFTLAVMGEGLHAYFVVDHGIEEGFFKAGRVQIIAAAADSYLPVELLYALPAPTIPELCKNWKKVVVAGTCPECEAGYGDGDVPVCLTGFWGIRYVVERHVHEPGYSAMEGDYRLQNEPLTGRDLIKPLESIVWGVSDNVIDKDRTSLARFIGKAPFAAIKADAWDDLQEKIGTLDPSLVFLLPHTDFKGALEASEIGGVLDLVSQVERRMCKPREKNVVVVLLGCDTASTEIPFQGLVPRFRRAGAKVVITTINTILGRHAVPVAKELLKLIDQQAEVGEKTLGEVMRDLRRQSLADGYPMVLSVAAFGDADWKLGK